MCSLPRGISRTNGCTCSFHSCHEFRVVLPSRAFDNTIRTFGYGKNGEETKKREERKSRWGVAVELLQILKIFFSTENYMSRLRITYNEQTWMFTCINVKTLEEFFLSLSGRGGGW